MAGVSWTFLAVPMGQMVADRPMQAEDRMGGELPGPWRAFIMVKL